VINPTYAIGQLQEKSAVAASWLVTSEVLVKWDNTSLDCWDWKGKTRKSTPPPRACLQVHVLQPLQTECWQKPLSVMDCYRLIMRTSTPCTAGEMSAHLVSILPW